jgi:diguanylate cyclase (GGDEF)-like protein
LTGLANRALLEDRLNLALAESRRARTGVGLLLIDLDGFKAANDELGHAFGDALLREFAGRLTKRVRQVDTVARLGGDEFVVVLPGLAEGEITPILKRIVDAAAEPFVIEGRSHKLDASVGVAVYPADAEDALSLLRHADVAMYHAKSQGEHGHTFYRDVVQAVHA